MINQWEVDNLKKTIEELKETIREKDNLILSENDMNNFLKTQNESLKIIVSPGLISLSVLYPKQSRATDSDATI